MPWKDKTKQAAYKAAWKKRKQADPAWRAQEAASKQTYRQAHPDYVKRQTALVVAQGHTYTPLANSARQATYRAIQSGQLVRPEQCEACGKSCKPDAAHYDYRTPLRVRWLCRSCHLVWDHQDPKGGYVPVRHADSGRMD